MSELDDRDGHDRPPAPRVLVVGFDAADRDAADELIAQGRMPNLARLVRDGWSAQLANPFGMFSGPVWPTIATGVSPARHGAYTWRPLEPGTYRMQYRGPNGPVAHPPFWSALAERGLRCTVIDLPNVEVQPFDGVQLAGWRQHDHGESFAVWPPTLADDLRREHPATAPDPCDLRGANGELAELRAELLAGVEQKVALVDWLARREPVDLLAVVFGESHCAGHQYWHLHDPDHPQHDPTTRAQLGDVVAEVYSALDAALGRLLERFAVDQGHTDVVVILSHGISPTLGVPHLLDPVLKAIDASLGSTGAWVRARELARRTPNRMARLVLRALHRPIEPLAHYVDGSRRFFPSPNFAAYGAIRLNLVGREPAGLVAPADADAVLDLLERELLALRDARTGEPAVLSVHRTSELYDLTDDIGMPDLLVEWDLSSPLTEVTSPTIGVVRGELGETRTGGHRQDGRVVLYGPDITPGTGAPVASVDVAPTLAALLGTTLPDVEGTPISAARTAATAEPLDDHPAPARR